MSNWKRAFAWSGHIIVPDDEGIEPCSEDNIVVIPRRIYDNIGSAMENGDLDERIEARPIGVGGESLFIAIGTCFSEGFRHYGSVFKEAEARSHGGAVAIDHDSEYMQAMEELYCLEMPVCRLMFGCYSEH